MARSARENAGESTAEHGGSDTREPRRRSFGALPKLRPTVSIAANFSRDDGRQGRGGRADGLVASQAEGGAEGEIHAGPVSVEFPRRSHAVGEGRVRGIMPGRGRDETRLPGRRLEGHVASRGQAEYDTGFRSR
jgi:hypothetical protein